MSEIKPLRKGEFDLVNISLIGHDPITGRSFQECADEWRGWLNEVNAGLNKLKWWQVRRRVDLARKVWILKVRQGME
jgi:hypothetical protein